MTDATLPPKEHADFPLYAWQCAVRDARTFLGYLDWVAERIEARGEILDFEDPVELRRRDLATLKAARELVARHHRECLTFEARDENNLGEWVVHAVIDSRGNIFARDADRDVWHAPESNEYAIAWTDVRDGEVIFTKTEDFGP